MCYVGQHPKLREILAEAVSSAGGLSIFMDDLERQFGTVKGIMDEYVQETDDPFLRESKPFPPNLRLSAALWPIYLRLSAALFISIFLIRLTSTAFVATAVRNHPTTCVPLPNPSEPCRQCATSRPRARHKQNASHRPAMPRASAFCGAQTLK